MISPPTLVEKSMGTMTPHSDRMILKKGTGKRERER
jgi:hypothetical protein